MAAQRRLDASRRQSKLHGASRLDQPAKFAATAEESHQSSSSISTSAKRLRQLAG